MSATAIAQSLPALSHEERRQIMALLLQVEEDAATLNEIDQLALERFQMLDAMEDEDEKAAAR
jgi:DNA-binding transcriptional ArsR family regulator